MKIEWLLTNATAIGSPARAESDFVGKILNVFWPILAAVGSHARAKTDFLDNFDVYWPSNATFVVGEPLCDLNNCQVP